MYTVQVMKSGGAVVFYNGGGQEYGMSTGRGTVANTAQVVVKYNGPPAVRSCPNIPEIECSVKAI